MLSQPFPYPITNTLNRHTSKSLKAALLFNPWTFASLAKESLPCLLFHLVEEEDGRLKDPPRYTGTPTSDCLHARIVASSTSDRVRNRWNALEAGRESM